MIEVLKPGTWTTIQDRGRFGFERLGIPVGGTVDWFSAAAANRLVGNHGDAALLECTLEGPALRFESRAAVALAGGECSDQPTWTAQAVAPGTTLRVGRIAPGLRAYLAVRGGIAVRKVMGSRSLCQRGVFGGGFGRPLGSGDRLPVGRVVSGPAAAGPWPRAHRLPLRGPWEVRVLPGPHQEAFSADALRRFLDTACVVTPEVDRMGMRLKAPALRLPAREILTTPVPEGGVQVTPSGELIVLLAEHQTTGGYPLIATVISADLPLLAQARPGDTVHFRAVSLAEAQRARRRLALWLSG